MTAWERHHPPHDHPDFNAYLDTLTDDDLAAINTAIGSAPPTTPPAPAAEDDHPKK